MLKEITEEQINIFSKKEFANLAPFLLEHDNSQEPFDKIQALVKRAEYKKDILAAPAKTTAQTRPPVQPRREKTAAVFTCGKCQSTHIRIAYGGGYYFKCNDCQGNTAIMLTCDQCGGPARTRKQKNEFYKVCATCNIEKLYFINPEE